MQGEHPLLPFGTYPTLQLNVVSAVVEQVVFTVCELTAAEHGLQLATAPVAFDAMSIKFDPARHGPHSPFPSRTYPALQSNVVSVVVVQALMTVRAGPATAQGVQLLDIVTPVVRDAEVL